MSVKNELEKLKKIRIEEILNDNNLNKIEKIRTLREEMLFNYLDYIPMLFDDWHNELKESLSTDYIIADEFVFSPSQYCFERHQIVYFDVALNIILERYQDVNDVDIIDNPMIPFLEDRITGAILYKNYSDIVDKVYDYCIDNKVIGYKLDW